MTISDERGFALPFTIFVIAIITMLLASIFGQVQVDRRIAESVGDGVDATSIAQSGLQMYLAIHDVDPTCYTALRPPDGDSLRINATGGYADVIAHVIREPGDTINGTYTYVVRSTGFVIEPTAGTDPVAQHTIAQFANWQRGTINMQAAFLAANGLTNPLNGTGAFHGNDHALPAGCKEDVMAIRVPAGGSPLPMLHDTNGLSPRVVDANTPEEVANLTGIDWATTIGGGIIPDYTTIQTWDSSYPVMLITGDVTFNVSATWGYGTLIVTGDLTITGTDLQWNGVVLVGGRINFNNTDSDFDGIVISGLNHQISGPAPVGSLGPNDVHIDLHSNHVRRAMQSFAGFVPIVNAWADNWATY